MRPNKVKDVKVSDELVGIYSRVTKAGITLDQTLHARSIVSLKVELAAEGALGGCTLHSTHGKAQRGRGRIIGTSAQGP